MVETITPVVYGGRARWIGGLMLHVAGATITAAAFGALLGAVGEALGAPFGRAGLVALAALALVYAAGTLPRVPVAIPQLRRQVPDWWRTFFSPGVTAFLYGAGLGIGFLTFVSTGALVVVSLAAALSGSAAAGAVVVGAFGLARGTSAIVAANVRSPEDGRRLVDRLSERRDEVRRIATGVSLVGVAALALAALPDAAHDGVGALAAATVAVVFAAAATAKLTGLRRWRRVLAARELPPPVARVSAIGVPLAELAVPVLALLGMPSAASWWALALLVAFSAEIWRVRRRRGGAVACGCFGGRRERPAPQLLARNAAVGALAATGALVTANAMVLRWPGAPGTGEVVPMVLALAGLAVAASAAVSASVWLSRGRA